MSQRLNGIARAALVLAALAAVACSTPIVTGIKVHMQNGEYQEAIHLADSVIAAGDSLDAELWLWRGKAQGFVRDWIGASESFGHAYRLDPALGPELEEYWFVFYNAAATTVQDDYDRAVQYLETGRSVVPARPEFDQMLGDLALQEGDIARALDHFEVSWTLGEAMIARYGEMLSSAPPEQVPAIQEMLDNAESNALLSLYNSATLHKALAMSADTDEARQGHLDDAVASLTTALGIDAMNADVLNMLAQVYLLSGRYEDAMAVFDDALVGVQTGLDEGWLTEEDAVYIRGEIMLTRGVALLEMQDFAGAVSEFEAALQITGPSYILLGNLAQAHIMLEDYEEAMDILEEAVMLGDLTDTERANAWYMEFAALTQMERDSEAASALERALGIMPDNADWWEYLASTYSRLNRRADAIEAMERALELRGEI